MPLPQWRLDRFRPRRKGTHLRVNDSADNSQNYDKADNDTNNVCFSAHFISPLLLFELGYDCDGNYNIRNLPIEQFKRDRDLIFHINTKRISCHRIDRRS